MIRLRPAEPQDEWTFWQIRREIQPDLLREEHMKWWHEVWEHRYIAYDGLTRLVGVIRLSEPQPGYVGPVGLVHLQVVRKEQRKGLGTEMLTVIQRVAQEIGFTTLRAQVSPGNIPSQKAFEKAGFQPTQFEITL